MTAPPTHDPEGCDRVAENLKRVESDLVVDGDLYCATDDGNCDLMIKKVITTQSPTLKSGQKIAIHILRAETEAYGRRPENENAIIYCYPPELWSPSQGHYVGRFYLHRELDGQYRMAFYPRVSKEY